MTQKSGRVRCGTVIFSGEKLCRWFFFFSLFTFPKIIFATALYCQIAVQPTPDAVLKITCTATQFAAQEKIELRFLERFAGLENLSDRVTGLQIRAAKNVRILPEIYGQGVYRLRPDNQTEFSFSYELKPWRINSANADPSRYSLVSSLTAQAGTILLADALPEICGVNEKNCAPALARVKLTLPPDWQVATTEKETYGALEIADVRKAVLFVGQLKPQLVNLAGINLQVAVAGNVGFSELQAVLATATLVQEQIKFMRHTQANKYLITLLPFPVAVSGTRAAALTRGQNVVMMINADTNPDVTRKLYQRLLAHELFHFYLPESFQVRENFDWFWEGFSRYAGLLTLNRLGLLNRRELWDEMQNECDAYYAIAARRNLSLLAASAEKFTRTEAGDLIYRKGTLVAWLFDLEMRRQSAGRANVTDVLYELYKNYGHTNYSLGNREVLAALRKAGKFDSFIKDYIEGTREIDIEKLLKPHGILADTKTGRTRILLTTNPSAAQKLTLAQFAQ